MHIEKRLPARHSLSAVCLLAAGLLVSLATQHYLSAEKQAEQYTLVDGDLTEKVEVEVSSRLRASRSNTYFTSVKVTNSSEGALKGPLLLVIRGTGVQALSVTNADGRLDSGDLYFTIITADARLRPGKSSKPRKITFSASKRLSLQDRRQFALETQVVRQRGEANHAVEKLKTDVEGNPKPEDNKKKRPSAEAVRRVMRIQDRATDRFLKQKHVVGTATAMDSRGRLVVAVYAEQARVAAIPSTVEGVPVKVYVTGRLFARQTKLPVVEPIPVPIPEPEPPIAKPPGRSVRSQGAQRFDRPVPIGISVGHERRCSAGTIACRVRKPNGDLFVLSNNHVLALQNAGSAGDDILQPGLVDTNCQVSQNNVIGELVSFVSILVDTQANRVDAAIATTTAAAVGIATPSDGYGAPTSQTVTAGLFQTVQKYGRTSGLTDGLVIGLNATVNVRYDAGTARFVDQIVVAGFRSGFIRSGDSGALLVTKPGREPVGLLFAGSMGGRFAIANPIDAVLQELGVTIDGESPTDEASTPPKVQSSNTRTSAARRRSPQQRTTIKPQQRPANP